MADDAWDVAVRTAGVAAAAAAGLSVAALLDAEALRAVADRLAPDGAAADLALVSDARLAGALRELAATAAVMASALLLFRRPCARFLRRPPAAAPTPGPARIGRLEAAAAGGVMATGAALAVRDLSLPVRGDEATTFLLYATHSFWNAWSDYSLPNNHVLHTVLVWTAHRLGGWDLAVLRTPAFLAACLTLPATWWFVRREYGWPAAAFATALLATSPYFLRYAASARGYSLLLLCFVLALLCAQAIAQRPEAAVPWALFAGVIGLGMLAIPLMVFPAAITVAWMLLLRWREHGAAALPAFALRTACWSGVALAVAAAGYVPALLASGGAALLDNPYVQSRAGEGVSPYAAGLAGGVVRSWFRWHPAPPVWAQAALLAAIAVGAAAPRRSTGCRGLLAAAVFIGTAAVLVARPVVLPPRMTIFLLPAAVTLAGVGAAALCEALLARLTANPQARAVLRAGAMALFLGVFAARAAAVESFTGRLMGWPAAPLLAAAVEPELRPGDCTAAYLPAELLIRLYLQGAGRDLSPGFVDRRFPADLKPFLHRVDGAESDVGGGRLFVFVDGAVPQVTGVDSKGRRVRGTLDARTMRRHFEARGYDYRTVVDLPAGKVFRLDRWPCRPDSGFGGSIQPLRHADHSGRNRREGVDSPTSTLAPPGPSIPYRTSRGNASPSPGCNATASSASNVNCTFPSSGARNAAPPDPRVAISAASRTSQTTAPGSLLHGAADRTSSRQQASSARPAGEPRSIRPAPAAASLLRASRSRNPGHRTAGALQWSSSTTYRVPSNTSRPCTRRRPSRIRTVPGAPAHSKRSPSGCSAQSAHRSAPSSTSGTDMVTSISGRSRCPC